MKKLIDGKRYDTDKAETIAFFDFLTPDNPTYWSETLYRKRTGEYFLHGVGGPMSRYAEPAAGNTWTGSEKLFPLTQEAARDWARKCMNPGDYERIFEAGWDDEKRTVGFSLPKSVIAMIKEGAATRGISLSEYVVECVKSYRK